MGIVGASVDPHDKMRAKDITKVAKGEQAAHPVHQGPLVSKAPPPSSTDPHPKGKDGGGDRNSEDKPWSDLKRNCCIRYYEYYRCIQENEGTGGASQTHCEKFAKKINSECQDEWIKQWDEERERGSFPLPLQ